jgi:DNA (cytosine-5)-methyltransferase 1
MGAARAYYNEIDSDAVHVLRALIADGVIAPGDVDDRSIKDVSHDDLRGYTQCHFFAGGGLWSVAARLAGWPDERPLWTGSCPCQPFSVAGQRAGADDPRHLWPDFHRLIRAGRPAVVMGEQVAGKAGRNWFNGVRADLAGSDYDGRAVDIPACAVDAPHQRNRLYWIAVADSDGVGRFDAEDGSADRSHTSAMQGGRQGVAGLRELERVHGLHRGALVDASRVGRGERRPEHELRSGRAAASITDGPSALGDTGGAGLSTSEREAILGTRRRNEGRATEQPDGSLPGRNGSWWADAERIECHDGKTRRAQSGTPLLVDGLPGRVGLWRLAGNAISPVLAAEVIGAFLDTELSEAA